MIDAGATPAEVYAAVRARDPGDVPGGDGHVSPSPEPQFSEEELRAIEAEMEQLTVDDVLLQTIVSLINLGRPQGAASAAPPGEAPREPDSSRCARRSTARGRCCRSRAAPRRAARPDPRRAVAAADGLRPALRRPGRRRGAAASRRSSREQRGPGSAQSSGRLWVPGQ